MKETTIGKLTAIVFVMAFVLCVGLLSAAGIAIAKLLEFLWNL